MVLASTGMQKWSSIALPDCTCVPVLNIVYQYQVGPIVQGRIQPHSPGWARVPLSSFFPQILINFLIFPQTLLIFFLILALRVGDSPTREGPGYATAIVYQNLGLNEYTFSSG